MPYSITYEEYMKNVVDDYPEIQGPLGIPDDEYFYKNKDLQKIVTPMIEEILKNISVCYNNHQQIWGYSYQIFEWIKDNDFPNELQKCGLKIKRLTKTHLITILGELLRKRIQAINPDHKMGNGKYDDGDQGTDNPFLSGLNEKENDSAISKFQASLRDSVFSILKDKNIIINEKYLTLFIGYEALAIYYFILIKEKSGPDYSSDEGFFS